MATLPRFATYIDNYINAEVAAGKSVVGQTTGAQILADPVGTIGTDLTLAARSAAWYWATNDAKTAKTSTSASHSDGTLDSKALSIKWAAKGIDANPSQESAFDEISRGVGLDSYSYPARWSNYTHDVGGALEDGNPTTICARP